MEGAASNVSVKPARQVSIAKRPVAGRSIAAFDAALQTNFGGEVSGSFLLLAAPLRPGNGRSSRHQPPPSQRVRLHLWRSRVLAGCTCKGCLCKLSGIHICGTRWKGPVATVEPVPPCEPCLLLRCGHCESASIASTVFSSKQGRPDADMSGHLSFLKLWALLCVTVQGSNMTSAPRLAAFVFVLSLIALADVRASEDANLASSGGMLSKLTTCLPSCCCHS